ncbi:enoyl-CoA hydratase-related protein [Myxococcota bacterium]|nr:enoyl-CoA hydratase-related protein [Myxococcota bacterium]
MSVDFHPEGAPGKAEGRIGVEERGGVAVLTLDRPARRNALTPSMLAALVAAVEGAGRAGARVLVLRGAGRAAFCAGLDHGELGLAVRSGEGEGTGAGGVVADPTGPLAAALRALDEFHGPTLALLNGHVVGGGGLLALACDLRYAHPGVEFTVPASRLGLVYPLEGIRKLVALVGPGRALEVLYTAEPLGAEEAARSGLYNRLFPEDSLGDEVMALAGRIASRAPLALAGTRRVVSRLLALGRDPAVEAEADGLFRASLLSADAGEGIRALIERRDPRFEGR